MIHYSLVATIRSKRAELLDKATAGKPIPETPPPGFFKDSIDTIEGIGQPTTASFFLLSKVDPSKW